MVPITKLHFILGLFGFVFHWTGAWGKIDPPVIEILSWMETDEYRWKSGNEMEIQGITHNKTTFIIPGDIHGLIISCNASYPIEWEFSPDENVDPSRMVFSLYTMPSRQGNSAPFLFSMKLFLYGDTNAFTGKYICKRTGDSDRTSFFGSIETEIYIFWEGNSPPYLMGAGKTFTVSSSNQGNVRLPCQVSFPEVDVFLQRKINVTNTTVVGNKTINITETKWVNLEFSSNTSGRAPIIYDPSVGFLLDNPMEKNKSIDGEYKCMTLEKDDMVTVQVTPDKIPSPEDNHAGKYQLDKNARLFYNDTTQQFTCCSNTDKPPNIFVFYCISYAHCRIATPLIYHNMVAKVSRQYYGRITKDNCVSTYIYQGAYRCFGDGVDITKTVFSDYHYYYNGTYKREIFWSWQDITPEKQKSLVGLHLQVMQKPGVPYYISPWYYYQAGYGPPPILYTGQNISFTCSPAMFYYADGVAWKIRWKNQSDTTINSANDRYGTSYWFYSSPKSAYVLINTQIKSVVCLAPIWNSTEWVEKEFLVNATVPIPPTVSSPNAQNLYWTLNDTKVSIRCDGTGDPAPTLHWFKNGKVVDGTTNILLDHENGSLTITFFVAEYSIHGTYVCVAENLVSKAEKVFNVYIEEAHPWAATAIITTIVLVFLIVIGVLAWRVKVYRTTAAELRWRTS